MPDVWVIDQRNTVRRIDTSRDRVVATIQVGKGPTAIAVDSGAVWVANYGDGSVSLIDPARSSTVARIAVEGRPNGIVVGAGAVWVHDQVQSELTRIDPSTGQFTRVAVPGVPVAATEETLWLVQFRGADQSTLVRFHTATGRMQELFTSWNLWNVCVVDSGRGVLFTHDDDPPEVESVSLLDVDTGAVQATLPFKDGLGPRPVPIAAVGQDVYILACPTEDRRVAPDAGRTLSNDTRRIRSQARTAVLLRTSVGLSKWSERRVELDDAFGMVVTAGSAWVSQPNAGAVLRIGLHQMQPQAQVIGIRSPTHLAAG